MEVLPYTWMSSIPYDFGQVQYIIIYATEMFDIVQALGYGGGITIRSVHAYTLERYIYGGCSIK